MRTSQNMPPQDRSSLVVRRLLFFCALITITSLGWVAHATASRGAVTIRLVDAESQREIPGLIRIVNAQREIVRPSELISRGWGLTNPDQPTQLNSIHSWSVLPRATTIQLPTGKYDLTAISGLESEAVQQAIEITADTTPQITLPLRRFTDQHKLGWVAGNTHLHLMKLTRDEGARYLTGIPQADRLDVLFLSYLERTGADRDYTSNSYTSADLSKFERGSGVLFGNGEEHRHNFKSHGQGYGHVMFLDIPLPQFVQPVSIGPGIMGMGTDGLPLQRGIESVRNAQGAVIWCHNAWGYEALPNVIMNKVDAQNIFDGSINSTYEDRFYPFLNAGYRIPFSAGTDWFLYDMSRTYVRKAGPPTIRGWLNTLKRGESFITNGPLLEFSVDGLEIGATRTLAAPGKVRVTGQVQGRRDFKRLELILDGRVIHIVPSTPQGAHFEARLDLSLDLHESGWLALRTPSPTTSKSKPSENVGTDDFGRPLFSHTSPIYVEIQGRPRDRSPFIYQLLRELDQSEQEILRQGTFADDQERARVLDVYHSARRILQGRLNNPASSLDNPASSTPRSAR